MERRRDGAEGTAAPVLGAEGGSAVGDGESLVEIVLAEHAQASANEATPGADGRSEPLVLHGVVVGVIAGLGPSGEPLVDFPGNPRGEPLAARSAAPVCAGSVGAEVALLFEAGDPARPLIVGLIQHPELDQQAELHAELPAAAPSLAEPSLAKAPGFAVEADGDRVVLSADKEIVLRCGEASITLTRAGKVLIRGAYLLARSSGVNRILGGSVQIN